MEVKIIQSEETRPLRFKVLWQHKANEESCVLDIDTRRDAIHIGAFEQGNLVSVASLFQMNNNALDHEKQYRLRAMASDPDFSGKGAGREVVLFSINLLREQGNDVLWCDAREVALGFYEKLGFKVLSDWYEVPEIGPHKLMAYEL
ncbi:MAG: putative GNAT family N-acyltransferase [Litorivivens sp.]|jgi:predicted GNAT family N-acyltransferase